MRIECPTCSIGFQVDDSQIGTKGRCPKCETKFIIPADPDDDIEVLEEGKVPEDEKLEKKDKEKADEKEKSGEKKKARDRDEEDSEDEEAEEEKKERREKKKKRAAEPKKKSKPAVEEVDDDDDLIDTSGVGKALGLLAIGLLLGLVIGFALGRLTAGESEGPGDEQTKKDAFGLSQT